MSLAGKHTKNKSICVYSTSVRFLWPFSLSRGAALRDLGTNGDLETSSTSILDVKCFICQCFWRRQNLQSFGGTVAIPLPSNRARVSEIEENAPGTPERFHRGSFLFFGGIAKILTPDNLRTGVTKPNICEPDINPTYQELAMHYGAAVIPARVRRPKNKAKVESAVQNAERRILARLRNRTFFELGDVTDTVWEALEDSNNRPFQKMDGCRRSVFETLEKPALQSLPSTKYEFVSWKKARANVDYHAEVDHDYYAEWTPSRMVGWAKSIGPHTQKMAETILE